jgi:hypothetical protein
MLPTRPRRALRDGRPVWIFEDGHVLPVISGGDGPDDGDSDAGDKPTTKTLTQDEVDRIVEQRIARERAKYADYDDVKKKASQLDELEAANASELEKAQKRAEKAEQERDAARAEVETVRGESRAERISSAIIAQAVKAGAIDPEAVAALVKRDAVTIGDDGQVTGADKVVEALLAEKTYLVGTPSQPGPEITTPSRPKPDPGQGQRGNSATTIDAGRDLWRERHPQPSA